MPLQRVARAARAALRSIAFVAIAANVLASPARQASSRDAAGPGWFDRLYDEGQRRNAALKTLTARFTEVTTSTLLTRPLTAHGTLAVDRPSHVVLRYAEPGARIVVANYYNPFLAAYLTGPAGQAIAQQSIGLQTMLNTIIAGAAASVGAEVADVATAFRSTDGSLVNVPALGGMVPTNVATICGWTWMCQLGDIHANDAGYAVMTGAVRSRRAGST